MRTYRYKIRNEVIIYAAMTLVNQKCHDQNYLIRKHIPKITQHKLCCKKRKADIAKSAVNNSDILQKLAAFWKNLESAKNQVTDFFHFVFGKIRKKQFFE